MGLRQYILKRIMYSVILLFAFLTVNFGIFHAMPGDPLQKYAESVEAKMTEQEYMELRKYFGLDQSLQERYVLYIKNTLTFNFGKSRETGISVVESISERLGNTLLLMGLAAFLSISVGTLLGTLLAYKRGSRLETGVVTSALTLSALPVFWIGWLILYFFAVQLGWFQVGGTYPKWWAGGNMPTNPLMYIGGRLWAITLPILTLFIFNFDGWMLLTRACVLGTITDDYVVTARAKGLKERTVLLKHVLKPASLPLITAVALTFAFLWNGAIITETLFAYNGMGMWIWAAIYSKDIPAMYVIFFISGLLVIIANFAVDLVYGLIDPRIKVGQ